jgi:glutathionyl-hydroquinone reductase
VGKVRRNSHTVKELSHMVTGWKFALPGESFPGENTVPDPINGANHIRDLYLQADPNYSGQFSVPVLWDNKSKAIVSNESSEIIRMFGTEFDELLDADQIFIFVL